MRECPRSWVVVDCPGYREYALLRYIVSWDHTESHSGAVTCDDRVTTWSHMTHCASITIMLTLSSALHASVLLTTNTKTCSLRARQVFPNKVSWIIYWFRSDSNSMKNGIFDQMTIARLLCWPLFETRIKIKCKEQRGCSHEVYLNIWMLFSVLYQIISHSLSRVSRPPRTRVSSDGAAVSCAQLCLTCITVNQARILL